MDGNKRSTVIVAVIIIFAIAGLVIVSLQKLTLDSSVPQAETSSTTEWANAPAEKPSDILLSTKTIINAKHAYQDGKHIIAGEVPLPTACHILESNATALANKKQVLVTLNSSIKSGETCPPQVISARFKLIVEANKDAKIVTTLNGQEVTLNLIEAGPNENLDNFDLYIKG